MKKRKIIKSLLMTAAALILAGCSLNGQKAGGEIYENIPGSSEAITGSHEQNSTSDSTTSFPGQLTAPELTEHETDTVKAPAADEASMRRVAYFTSWSAYARGLGIGDMDPNLLTHVNFAFANVSSEGEILVGDSWADTEMAYEGDTWDQSGVKGHFGQIKKMKKKYPHLKFLISTGGWTWSGNFSEIAASEAGRKRFADSAAAFLIRYGFDGIDIDWEFPVEGGNGIAHRPEDGHNYTLLLQEVRAALDSQGAKDGNHYLLTVAGGPNVSFARNTELAEMMKYLDFMNIMTYDYHGSWESSTGHNAPLYAADGLSVSDTVEAYLNAGAVPEKLNLGLAFYGRGWGGTQGGSPGQPGTALNGTGYGVGTWEGGVFDYWDLRTNYEGKNGYVRYYDEQARVPYLSDGSTFISYDDTQSVREKLSYAGEKKLGGIMFWEFSGDKNKEIQTVIAEFCKNTVSHEAVVSNSVSEGAASGAQSTDFAETASEWSKETVYDKGDTVTYQGHTYRAKWWTQAETPAEHSNEWDVWTKMD